MKKGFAILPILVTIAVASVVAFTANLLMTPAPQGAAINAVGGKGYNLSGSGVSATQNTIGLTNFDIAGATIDLIMSDFGALGCGTLEPGHTTRQEFISFTGVTQNADDSATLTGVTRGLSPVPDYTASTTQQKAHSGSSKFVISNSPPCFYEGYASLTQNEAVIGAWNYNTNLPTTSLTPTTATQFATKGYIDGVAIAGGATSTESVYGLTQLATQIEAASTTPSTANDNYVLQAGYSTSTPDGTSQAGLFAVISRNSGKIHQLWLDLTEKFTFAELETTATTTIAASDVNNNALVLNGQPYAFPPSDGTASSTSLQTDGSGGLSWNTPNISRYSFVGDGGTASTGWATTTLFTLPAGTVTASSTIEVHFTAISLYNGGSGHFRLALSDGTPITSFPDCGGGSNGQNTECTVHAFISFISASSQLSMWNGTGWDSSDAHSRVDSGFTGSVDMSGEVTIELVLEAPNASNDINVGQVSAVFRK